MHGNSSIGGHGQQQHSDRSGPAPVHTHPHGATAPAEGAAGHWPGTRSRSQRTWARADWPRMRRTWSSDGHHYGDQGEGCRTDTDTHHITRNGAHQQQEVCGRRQQYQHTGQSAQAANPTNTDTTTHVRGQSPGAGGGCEGTGTSTITTQCSGGHGGGAGADRRAHGGGGPGEPDHTIWFQGTANGAAIGAGQGDQTGGDAGGHQGDEQPGSTGHSGAHQAGGHGAQGHGDHVQSSHHHGGDGAATADTGARQAGSA